MNLFDFFDIFDDLIDLAEIVVGIKKMISKKRSEENTPETGCEYEIKKEKPSGGKRNGGDKKWRSFLKS